MLTPLSKIILISIASLAVATLLVRLFLRSRRNRPAGPSRPGLLTRLAARFRRSRELRPPAQKPIAPLAKSESLQQPSSKAKAPARSTPAAPAEPHPKSIHSDAAVQRPEPALPASSTLPKLEPADVPVADTSD
ncbi:MAG: hypothetical protein ACF8TS_05545, partial [Maioricimonas sp. JB049]